MPVKNLNLKQMNSFFKTTFYFGVILDIPRELQK